MDISERETICDKFQELLDEDIVQRLEAGIYKYAIEFNKGSIKRTYMNKCISIYQNLNCDGKIGNSELYCNLTTGQIEPEDVAYMTPQEVFPEHWKELVEKKKATDHYLYMRKPQCNTNAYTCGKCKQNNCNYTEVQIRSADEPMTLFITCLNPKCGYKWKM